MSKEKRYSEEDLQKAVEEVTNNSLTVYRAQKIYNIPKTTLSSKLKGKREKKHGKEGTLSADTEKLLADWVCLCADSGNPKTSKEILEAAGELASLERKKFIGGTPTSGWLKCFRKRHPTISKRTPETLGKSSALLTQERLKAFFDYVYKQLQKAENLELLDRPSSWWNVDETNFVMNPVPKKVFARKGAKVVYNVERGKPKENITCTYAVAADGNFMPPLVTFKDTFSNLVGAATTSGSIGANFGFNQTASGWMKGEAFYFFVTQHLNPRWIEMKIQRPIALVVDGYSGHHSAKLYRWCLDNDVVLIVLYPNSTHILQVLDVALFGPLKAKYTEIYQKWKTNNPDKMFNEIEFIKLLKQTNDEVINKETIINGWRSTGLQPFNFENVKLNRLVLRSETPQTAENPNPQPPERQSPEPPGTDSVPCHHAVSSIDMTQMISLDEEPISYHLDDNHSHAAEHQSPEPPGTDSVPCHHAVSSIDMTQMIALESNNRNDEDFEESVISSHEIDLSFEIQSPLQDRRIKQLISNARDAVDELRNHLNANDPSKLLNILIMEQQLNIIDPIVINHDLPSTSVKTVSDILKTPSAVPHKPPRQRKGLKISYGVMSDKEIVTEMEARELEEKKIADERKKDNEDKNERNKKLKEIKDKLSAETDALKATRAHLKTLEAEAAEERKKVAAKRKNIAASKKSKQLIPPECGPKAKRRKN